MVRTSLIACLGLASFCDVALANPPSSARRVSFVDTFDDIPVIVDNGGANLVDNRENGALNYTAFGAAALDPAIIRPASSPNVAATDLIEQLPEGEPSFQVRNSSVACFDLQKIFIACSVITAQDAVTVAEACTVQFTGTPAYAGSAPPQVIEDAVYNQQGVLKNMTAINFPSTFSCLSRVDVAVLSAVNGNSGAQVAFFIDNVTYSAYITK